AGAAPSIAAVPIGGIGLSTQRPRRSGFHRPRLWPGKALLMTLHDLGLLVTLLLPGVLLSVLMLATLAAGG
ncbi:MAG: hypothetical protein RLZZ624_514, partial [Cyanobacteriota bacterium]